MADTNKKEYTSNLHPKGDLGTTVYPNVKSENIIDKDTTAYTAGKVPDSSLVQKSLDGLNEKIETNKIQTDTNKTNIATLQGDVTLLKQDNQTTKTTIAGLISSDTTNKTNIAKNTQDIANLKANYTEVQSQANQNSIDISLLKTNTIKKDTDASLKSLTLPSASDLKTKDGTSFGGGDTSSIPTDINVDSDFNLVLEHDGKVITGQKKLVKSFKYAENGDFVYDKNIYIYNSSNGNYKEFKYIFDSYGHRVDNGGFHYFENEQNSDIYYSGFNIYIKSNNITSPYSLGFLITKKVKADTCIFSIKYTSQDDSSVGRTLNLPTKSGTIARIEDLATKQSTLYRHTVTIYKPSEVCFRFTDYSEKNTVIDSVQDLITVFGNTKISGSGSIVTLETGLMSIYIGIDVGTTIDNTVMINSNDLEQENFTDVFGTTGFTITDEVTPM